ncbi:M14 family zinc carboxypeptidase, partial [candidate division KSB1 bacterium]
MKIKYTILPIIIIFLAVFHGTALSQDEDLFPGGRYNSEIPTPLEILGHRFGEVHTFHWEMEKYIHEIDRVSDRVKVFNYGRSYQGRDLYYILIGSRENISRYEEIRQDNLRLTDPRITSAEEAERLSDSLPAIVWLGYNIHGNEASSMEAAIRVLYQLAGGTDETTMNLLDNVLCIIDPNQNPDGHDRFVQSVRSVVTLKSHPQTNDVEHSSAWPGGRGNHYFFDLNRDFFLKTQVESLMKTRIFHEWRPHVFVDHH